jgi:2-methylisocitrate lyase-like PEP mutase family enzyme
VSHVAPDGRRAAFRDRHLSGPVLLMPNAWDVGSAKLLDSLGFEAIATTSAGFAWTLGKHDQAVTREELLAHVAALGAAVDLPLSVDSERLYAESTDGVAETVRLLAEAGAAGCSIEDYDPAADRIEDTGRAAERVAAAADEARRHGLTLTARAENHLYGRDDLDDTIGRLVAYRDAGADVLYAPGLRDPEHIAAVVQAVDAPVNVLALPGGPTVADLEALGVRRVSTGGALASAAYGALLAGARELLTEGTATYARAGLRPEDRTAFSARVSSAG